VGGFSSITFSSELPEAEVKGHVITITQRRIDVGHIHPTTHNERKRNQLENVLLTISGTTPSTPLSSQKFSHYKMSDKSISLIQIFFVCPFKVVKSRNVYVFAQLRTKKRVNE
jgi:hypothetical protein